MAKDSDILTDAKEAFEQAQEAEKDNRDEALDDLKFGRLGEQWPESVRKERENEDRPCLTINTIPASLRQVTNDARQNKPRISVRPADSFADIHTAAVYSGLIRNIENISKANIAYDTAIDSAASMGWGYFRIAIDYAYDDTFDKELLIQAVPNPFSVYGDPRSSCADSSDWNTAFITEMISREEFKRLYKSADGADWSADGYDDLSGAWRDDDDIMLAEWWVREEVKKEIFRLSNGIVIAKDEYEENLDQFAPGGIVPTQSRMVMGYKVTQRLMTGAEILQTNEWAGKYIPIVPVYGEEVNVKGKRHWRSLFRDAKDAKRMENYHRSAVTESLALAPKAPFIGPEQAFEGKHAARWDTANAVNYSYLAYSGQVAPQRQGFAGVPPGEMQEAMNAREDQKAIMGIHEASLGAPSNETSGRAILARQREGDVATFHFVDNLSRGIAHGGCILVDLIPKAYTGERMLRILGEDGEASTIQLQKMPKAMLGQEQGKPERGTLASGKPDLSGVFDLSVGRYDVVVETGPSYTTQRQESAERLTELVQAVPALGEIAGDILVKNFDFAGAQEVSHRIKAAMIKAGTITEDDSGQAPDPRVAQMQQQLQQAGQAIQEMQQQLQVAESGEREHVAKSMEGIAKAEVDKQKNAIEWYKAETDRIAAENERARLAVEMKQSSAELIETTNSGEALGAMMQAAQAMAATVAALQGQVQHNAMTATLPKMKRSKAVMPDGRVIQMETVEDAPIMPTVQ